jgi:hypothetical protein
MSNKAIAEALGIESTTEDSVDEPFSLDTENTESTEIDALAEFIGPELPVGHIETDYNFTRDKMKTFLQQGEVALGGIMGVVKEDPTARGYEVVSTMLKTVTDMATSFFDLQKKNKELHQGQIGQNGGKGEVNIRNGVVFAGDSASYLEQKIAERKLRKEE